MTDKREGGRITFGILKAFYPACQRKAKHDLDSINQGKGWERSQIERKHKYTIMPLVSSKFLVFCCFLTGDDEIHQ